jgi:5-formyltetrahydrofolate cyclo-ligase
VLLDRLLGEILGRPAAVIAGVWPLPGEIDLRPLLHTLHERGFGVALPETTPRGNPLIFRHWRPDSVMLPEKFGTLRPDGPVIAPDLFLVPLLAFDASGRRLGYGGGYYDRTLPLYPGRPALGFAYAAQQVANLPSEPHDHPLDAIVTEAGVIIPD